VIRTTTAGVGVAAGVGATVGVAVPATVGVAVAVLATVEVGVGPPLATVTTIEAVPNTALALEKALAEIVCDPLPTVVEFQLKVEGGVDARKAPST
jgi:hypothetical protein